jgi:hypothetical protein
LGTSSPTTTEERDDQEGEQHGEDRREPLVEQLDSPPPSAPMASEVSVTPSCIAAEVRADRS